MKLRSRDRSDRACNSMPRVRRLGTQGLRANLFSDFEAVGEEFEPGLTDPESVVLALHPS